MLKNSRRYTWLDQCVMQVDQGLRTIFAPTGEAYRPNPADEQPETSLAESERRLAAGLMRVNHAGEVSAQALYQGQALTARLKDVRDKMQQAADEEYDHLAWCEQRLQQLHSHTSYLNPIWYFGSFCIGAFAGLIGDKWSLGFVVETERQVVKHIQSHMQRLPQQDNKSFAILEQMEQDETHHATVALQSGGAELPSGVKTLMQLLSSVMTNSAFYL